MNAIALRQHYSILLKSDDPVQRLLAETQLERLRKLPVAHATNEEEGFAPSPWRHVPFIQLLEEAGNQVTLRSNGKAVSGHEPVHASKSGTCLVAWTDTGRWWCSSCQQRGDAISLLMSLTGVSFLRARTQLALRFGPPRKEADRGGG